MSVPFPSLRFLACKAYVDSQLVEGSVLGDTIRSEDLTVVSKKRLRQLEQFEYAAEDEVIVEYCEFPGCINIGYGEEGRFDRYIELEKGLNKFREKSNRERTPGESICCERCDRFYCHFHKDLFIEIDDKDYSYVCADCVNIIPLQRKLEEIYRAVGLKLYRLIDRSPDRSAFLCCFLHVNSDRCFTLMANRVFFGTSIGKAIKEVADKHGHVVKLEKIPHNPAFCYVSVIVEYDSKEAN